MPKTPPPVLGFNNNVRHQGRIFHIQTEDSGVKRPHVITHLFGDGGRILKTSRTDYSEHVGREDIAQVVRTLMKEQHKGMFVALRKGELDDVIKEAFGSLTPGSTPPPVSGETSISGQLVLSSAPPIDDDAKTQAAPPPSHGLPPVEVPPAAATPRLPTEPPRSAPPARQPSASRPVAIPALDRPSSAPPLARFLATSPPAASNQGDSPRARRPSSTSTSAPPRPDSQIPAEISRPRSDPNMGRYAVVPKPHEEERYAVARPAAIFGEAKPARNIFGGDELVGEKSLDEVILSYLAEDLEQPPRK
ncbi:MAG: hypothetical protein R3B13_01480 [Polyangiaceae bacterium]